MIDSIQEKYIPQISVQKDWFNELRSGNRKVWVSESSFGASTIYGEIYAEEKNGTSNIVASDGFHAEFLKKNLTIESTTNNIKSYFINPLKSINVHSKAVRNIDISAGGGLGVSCGDDEKMYIWETSTGNIRRSLEGHFNDVTHCRFFPSGLVVLSGGMDMRLKIWSVEDGSCPVTLVGHKGAITDTAIIDQGRNIISCSRDGNVLLWNCGTSECLTTLYDGSSVIHSCCMRSYDSNTQSNVTERSERECGTENKLLVFAKEDGHCVGCDVYSRSVVFDINCGAPLNTCCYLDDNIIAVGTDDGSILLIDIRKNGQAFSKVRHGKSRVVTLESYSDQSLLVGKGDGSCSCIKPMETTKFISMELTGPDYDPIYDITRNGNQVFTASRDGVIRKYGMTFDT